MDTTAIIALALLVVLALGFFLTFTQRGKLLLKGLGFQLELEGSNDPAASAPGVKGRDITAETGSVNAKDKTGRGVDVEGVKAYKNVNLTSEDSGGSPNPKG